ncbi:Sporulation domain protein [Magnetococcus marinus MC-1]|uniref:Sporulation domain protein n=2 Tax=Magnetococcus TaxID=162171 RepID=A0L7P4_MAGMM|nr:Sporulation domain protein [Magnetococcus marinus MC-1]
MDNLSNMLGRVLPWFVAAILAVTAVAFLWNGMHARQDDGPDAVWKGPNPVVARAMALPERMLVELEGMGERPKRADKPVEAKPPVVESKPVEPRMPPPSMVNSMPKTPPKPLVPVAGSQYIVQVGSFVYEFGAGQLLERLQSRGYESTVLEAVEMVTLNQVQAGPYDDLEAAKESEVKLMAGGFRVTIEKNWQGLIIPVGESMQLGDAISIMDKAEQLYVRPLRVVKIESTQKLYKVVMGPYKDEAEAKGVASRLADLGMTSPLIKIWYGGTDLKEGWRATQPKS